MWLQCCINCPFATRVYLYTDAAVIDYAKPLSEFTAWLASKRPEPEPDLHWSPCQSTIATTWVTVLNHLWNTSTKRSMLRTLCWWSIKRRGACLIDYASSPQGVSRRSTAGRYPETADSLIKKVFQMGDWNSEDEAYIRYQANKSFEEDNRWCTAGLAEAASMVGANAYVRFT